MPLSRCKRFGHIKTQDLLILHVFRGNVPLFYEKSSQEGKDAISYVNAAIFRVLITDAEPLFLKRISLEYRTSCLVMAIQGSTSTSIFKKSSDNKSKLKVITTITSMSSLVVEPIGDVTTSKFPKDVEQRVEPEPEV
ncbi:uncharacterized protein A4U43_C09F8760 [Asparagus officinalis]|uniref:Uncharacterized protein n=1 Tax=Asparagus officinalis TaxID=4686 RepID=A0A5P1E814_ASPOF|nr:uncharacterized protein A4U43_C09F8760 [Asparagus officinalis]